MFLYCEEKLIEIRLSSDLTGGLMPSSDNPLYFYAKILALPVNVVKYFKNVWNTKWFWDPSSSK